MITDRYKIREKNEQLVLELIIQHGQISRATVSQISALNKASVSEITKSLLEKELILEVGIGDSTNQGGRKPIMLTFNKFAGLSISIDIGANYISSALCFLDGEIITAEKKKNILVSNENIFELISEIVKEYQLKLNTLKKADSNIYTFNYGIIGMSLAIHGIVDTNNILFTPYYDLDQINLYERLTTSYSFPIHLENEANLTAIAENTFTTDQTNLVSLSIHSGVGAGIIINRKLYHGKKGMSGEIGHTILVPNGKPCPCGNNGCLEQYCSEDALLFTYASLTSSGKITVDELILAYDNKENIALKVVEEFSFYLAAAVNNIIATYAPEIVYLNSSLIRRIPLILEKVQQNLVSSFNKDIDIKSSTLGSKASLLGATSINIQKFLHVEKLVLVESENIII
ncbi:ROK family protein [Bacillus sp. B1-b2]|uniref:ROK family protein n=1 Tax=Bacillus sp. B1-b2 TaxID=2653201 RepID=UPI00126228A2|nr:ROK family protein [Bacillus sp. B1-b2]KAB7667626.1 ROK family protein [Bacillus sp. B1-b2]